MSSIYDLKPKFQNLLRPIVKWLAQKGITANHVTISAMLLSLAAGSLICLMPTKRWPLLMLPLVLFTRMALNAIDGMLAREHDMKTPLGAVLNELGDVFSDVALYLPFALIPGISAIWVVLAVLFAVFSEMAGVIAVQIGAERRYDGPMGKSDRAFVMGAAALIMGLGITPRLWMNCVLIFMLVLLGLTIVNRIRKALEEAT